MKKQSRQPEKYDVLELFSVLSAKYDHDITDEFAVDDFIERVRKSISLSKMNRSALFGKRTESMFAYVSGALGKVSLLKQEDAGDLFFTDGDLIVPDYRMTFHDGKQTLVEVKNFHSDNPSGYFVINKEYLSLIHI